MAEAISASGGPGAKNGWSEATERKNGTKADAGKYTEIVRKRCEWLHLHEDRAKLGKSEQISRTSATNMDNRADNRVQISAPRRKQMQMAAREITRATETRIAHRKRKTGKLLPSFRNSSKLYRQIGPHLKPLFRPLFYP